jgi:hypothetical protein
VAGSDWWRALIGGGLSQALGAILFTSTFRPQDIELPCSQNRHRGQDLSHGIEGFVLKSVLLFMLTIFVAAMGVADGDERVADEDCPIA